MAQCTSNEDVNNFFKMRSLSGEAFKNPVVTPTDLQLILRQPQYGDYGHRHTLLSDLATDPVPRQTQHALDVDLDVLAHHLTVRYNFRTKSEYTDEEIDDLKTYRITSHAALWAFNLFFTGTNRPVTSRVCLPSSAWIDEPM